ncbi:MAG: hypothetical protein SPF59_08605, partial [Oscillospiraceae bacterium]|nr:hypothetical protein [Oscillospiraceae bacterium]
QRLIDSFVNAVYLYEDKIILTFNYKDGSKTITLADVEGSDLSSFGAPRQNNTIRSLAAASGVRSTDGVVFPFQIEPAALGFDLVLGASFMCWHLYCYAITRRSKLCIACSDFSQKSERTHDAFAALPTFCGFKSISNYSDGIFFSTS